MVMSCLSTAGLRRFKGAEQDRKTLRCFGLSFYLWQHSWRQATALLWGYNGKSLP